PGRARGGAHRAACPGRRRDRDRRARSGARSRLAARRHARAAGSECDAARRGPGGRRGPPRRARLRVRGPQAAGRRAPRGVSPPPRGLGQAFVGARGPGEGVKIGSMALAILATFCAGLFAGAAIYVNAVEHPARLACGTALAVREFAPSYHRATIMQVPLAVVGLLASVGAWWSSGRITFVLG